MRKIHHLPGLESILKTHLMNTHTRVKCDECNQEICNAFLFKMLQNLPQPSNINFVQCSMSKRKNTFSNSGINKVAMVKNALLPMSLYSLLCVNEIIRCHLHIVDMNEAIWQILISHVFLLMSLLENATSPWGQSWERVFHKHKCRRHKCCDVCL